MRKITANIKGISINTINQTIVRISVPQIFKVERHSLFTRAWISAL